MAQLYSLEENSKTVNQRVAQKMEPASERSILFIQQILQNLIEKENISLERPRKTIANDCKALCLGKTWSTRTGHETQTKKIV